jgi:hypothetical protein
MRGLARQIRAHMYHSISLYLGMMTTLYGTTVSGSVYGIPGMKDILRCLL